MPLPSDQSVRAAISAIVTSAAPNAVVAGRWILRFEQGQWPGLLRPATGIDAGKTHGYVITRLRNGPATLIGLGRVKRFWTYSILGLHFYDTGTDASNSENLFKAEIDAITAALDAASVSGTKQVPEQMVMFEEDLKQYGTEFCHVALGTFVVEPCG